MATIVTRSGKGSPLTNSEVDSNFTNLNNDKLETSAAYVHPNHSGEVTSTADGATVIAADVVDAGNLKVTGNGTTSQFLRSDGDGTFTWATPTDTNTVYTHPTTAGNKHIPTGGTVGQILKNTASGTATWQADNNTTYSVGDGGLTQVNFTSALSSKLTNIETDATADQTAAQILTAIKTVDGVGSGLDADYLDGLSSTKFARNYTFNIGSASGSRRYVKLWTMTDNNAGVSGFLSMGGDFGDVDKATYQLTIGTRSAAISMDVFETSVDSVSDNFDFFYKDIGSSYEIWMLAADYNYNGQTAFVPISQFGSVTYNFDSITTTAPSGIVSVTKNEIWHSGNDGAGSGLDADLLDGLHVGSITRNNAANKVVRTEAQGHLNVGWINTTSGATTGTITDFYVSTNDTFIRKATNAHVLSQLNVEAGADVTDTTNVTAAGALMDSEVDADIKTLVLPASTTISTFGASLVDDLTASAAQTTLGLGSFTRKLSETSGTAGSTSGDWMTVASSQSGRHRGEVMVSDAESGDHAFIRIDWLRSYVDTSFTVLSCGGHSNRIKGVRVLQETADPTYGWKYLQVYVVASSFYRVQTFIPANTSGWTGHTAVTPIVQNTLTGYSVQGAALSGLDTYPLASQQGILAGDDIQTYGDILVGGTVDGVDIAARDAVLTSTTTTANAALPKAGGTMTGNLSFGDNDKAIFGAGSDLQIYHTGAYSVIRDVGAGALFIGGENYVDIGNAGASETYARFYKDAQVDLYYNGAVKLSTTSTGANVTGTVTADGLTVDGGANSELRIDTDAAGYLQVGQFTNGAFIGTSSTNATYGKLRLGAGTKRFVDVDTNGDISFYEDTGTTAKFFWDASTERLGIGTAAPSAPLTVSGDTTQIRLENTATGGRNWGLRTFGSALGIYDHTAGAFRQYIDNTGKVGIGNTAPATALDVTGTVTATSFSGGGGTMTGNLKFNNNNSVYYEHNSNGGFIPFPGNAQYIASNSAHTGAIKIKLPVHGSSDMISFHVDVYDYSTNESFSLFIAGYVYQTTGGNEWINVTVRNSTTNTAKDFTVRFGADGTNQCVWIGETNSTWSYPQITVRDLQVGYTADVDAWADDWAISFVTTFDTVDETISNNLPYAKVLNDSITGAQIADNAINSEHYADNSIDALHLNVSGNGTTSQFLRSDGDGTFTWATPTDTNAMPKSGGTFTGSIAINGNLVSVDNVYINSAIVSEGDLDTYMQFDAANNWRVVTGGSTAIRAHSSLITLSRAVSVTGGTLDMNNNNIVGVDQIIHEGDSNTYIRFHAADQFQVVTGGTERLEVNNTQITSAEPIHAPSFHGDGSSLTGIAAGAGGGGSDAIFWENGQNVTTNYTITNGKNAMSAGPITVDSGVTVTVGAGETWTVV